VASSGADPPYGSPGWQKKDEALRRIGTNAIPTLLKMIRAKDLPPAVLKVLELARSRRLLSTRYRYASTRNEEAQYAFKVLGPSAASAVPALIKIYERDVSPSSKRCAASALGSIGRSAQAALPVLSKDFTHTDGQVRFDAVTAVLFIGGDPKILVPALQSLLKDPMHEIRGNAAVALGNLEERARVAVPALLETMEDLARSGDNTQKGLVEYALWHIAPETVGKPLVVEEATPMLADGATTETLDVLSNGERRTFLPPGRPAPCVAQFWSRQPRGSLTLYRSAGPTTNAEHCLGEYEVVGIPPPPASVNVSLLCVIANRQIILCARDNNRPGFLEVRRVK